MMLHRRDLMGRGGDPTFDCFAIKLSVPAQTSVSFTFLAYASASNFVAFDYGDGTNDLYTDYGASKTFTHTYQDAGNYFITIPEDRIFGNTTKSFEMSNSFVTDILNFGNVNKVDFRNSTNLKTITENYTRKLLSFIFLGCISITKLPALISDDVFCPNDLNYSFMNCRGIVDSLKRWSANIGSLNQTFNGCTGLTGAWTDDPDELMPSRITSHYNTFLNASASVRSLFYTSWGGTRAQT